MTEYLLLFIYLSLFLFFIKRINFFKNIPGLTYKNLVLFFSIKFITGIILSLIYKYYYDTSTADIYKYYYDGLFLYEILWEEPFDYLKILTGVGITEYHTEKYLSNMSYWFRPWESPVYNDNRIIIRFNAFVSIFSFGYIHIHTLFANILSFTGLVGIYKFILKYLPNNKVEWLKWGIFLFPSLLFWGSGVLKEAILIGCFGLGIHFADKIFSNTYKKFTSILVLAVCLWVLLFLKTYILLLFLPCFIGFYISKKFNFIKTQLVYAGLFFLILIIGVIINYLIPAYSPFYLIADKHNSLVDLSRAIDAGSLLHEGYLAYSIRDILLNTPRGFLYTFTRPHIFETDSLLILFSALENILIKIMIVISLIFYSKKQDIPIRLAGMSFWFCIVGFAFIGLTTPVSGAIVRYKIIMLPFLWVLVLSIVNIEKIKKI